MKLCATADLFGKARRARAAPAVLPLALAVATLHALLQAYLQSRLPESLPEPWCSGSDSDDSAQCVEATVFREWQQTGAASTTAAVQRQTLSAKGFLEPGLHWNRVVDWRSNHGTNPPALKLESLRAAHWDGRGAPGVVCVALVPRASGAGAQLRRLVDDFHRQTYEGQRWLVLVHHEGDHVGAEIVQQLSNGSFIRGATARGPKYPSAAALRYGAWLAADADAVARWDVDARHHPERLSMQVRALALAGRPASLLRIGGARSGGRNGTAAPDDEHWDGSLVGESRWMREHWWPYSVGDSYLLEPPASHKIVHLDAPELLAYEDNAPAAAAAA